MKPRFTQYLPYKFHDAVIPGLYWNDDSVGYLYALSTLPSAYLYDDQYKPKLEALAKLLSSILYTVQSETPLYCQFVLHKTLSASLQATGELHHHSSLLSKRNFSNTHEHWDHVLSEPAIRFKKLSSIGRQWNYSLYLSFAIDRMTQKSDLCREDRIRINCANVSIRSMLAIAKIQLLPVFSTHLIELLNKITGNRPPCKLDIDTATTTHQYINERLDNSLHTTVHRKWLQFNDRVLRIYSVRRPVKITKASALAENWRALDKAVKGYEGELLYTVGIFPQRNTTLLQKILSARGKQKFRKTRQKSATSTQGLDFLVDELQHGNKLVGIYQKLITVNVANNQLEKAFVSEGFTITLDKYTQTQSFLSALPLSLGSIMIKEIRQFYPLRATLCNTLPYLLPIFGTMASNHAPHHRRPYDMEI